MYRGVNLSNNRPGQNLTRRRGAAGGSGNNGGNDNEGTTLKLICLTFLIIIVGFLLHLNYDLMMEFKQADAGRDGQENPRVQDLKEQVAAMKGNVDAMQSSLDQVKNSKAALSDGELPRMACSAEQLEKQQQRMSKRFNEWWSHSACPDQHWIEDIPRVLANDPNILKHGGAGHLVLDIGCNKGYTSADFLDALSPAAGVNPDSLVTAIRHVAKQDQTTYDRDCGVCNDCKKDLATHQSDIPQKPLDVHCFEPSPATFHMLNRVHDILLPTPNPIARWHIHNQGLHSTNQNMSWHKACNTAVGDELCTIVDASTPDAITVPVVTVDSFLQTLPNSPLVHMLKIDAEGLDPAVLEGATNTLKDHKAVYVMFEFNPGLAEKDPPHGMWGPKGKPPTTLLQTTQWLDDLGYDCYLDSRIPQGKEITDHVPDAPALYRITGNCLKEPMVRGWANIVCAARKYGLAAKSLKHYATIL